MTRFPLPLLLLFMAPSLPAENWADFRGPTADGVVAGAPRGLPTEWDAERNVVWKTEVKGVAWSSPVVFNDQVWVTNATEDGLKMSAVCLDRDSGKILHDLLLFENETVEPLGNAINGYGSPSPVIDEERVYIHFGSYGTAAISTKTGKEIWRRTDLPCRHFRGPGSSPMLYGDLLILTMDGIDVQYITALDGKTGKTVWKTDRSTKWDDIEPGGKIRGDGDFRKAYTTPTVTKVGDKDVLISPGAKSCFAYEPKTGKELWHFTYKGFSNASRTVVAGGHAFVNTGYGKPHLIAIKLDPKASGDITESHTSWNVIKRVPKRSSPIIVGKQLYMTTDEGILSCLDIATGDEIWSDRLKGHFSSSPIFADGKLYFFSQMGDCFVIKPGDSFELVATNRIDETGFMASPAVAGKAIFARSKTHVMRLEER